MTQQEQSGPGPINNNEAGVLSADIERKVLSREEIESMFNPSIPEFHGIEARNPSLEDKIKEASSAANLNYFVDLHMGESFVLVGDNPQMSIVHEALANGTTEEQELYEAIQDYYRTTRQIEEEKRQIEEDASLSEDEKDKKLEEFYTDSAKQWDLENDKMRQVGSLFRGLVKIPRITEDGLHQFLNLDENQELKKEHIINLSDIISSISYNLDKVATIKDSQFLDDVNKGDVQYGYQGLVLALSELSLEYDENNDEHVQRKVELEKAKLFFEKRFSYLEPGVRPALKRVFNSFKRLGSIITDTWGKIVRGDPSDQEIAEKALAESVDVEPTLEAAAENPSDTEAKTEVKPEKTEAKRSWWSPKPAVVDSDKKGPATVADTTGGEPIVVGGEVPVTHEGAPASGPGDGTEIKMTDVASDIDRTIDGGTEEAPAPVSPEKRQKALLSIKEKIEKGADWYNKQPKKVKFAVGAGLLVAGLTGAALSSGTILGISAAAKYALRGASAYAAGKGAEQIMENKGYEKYAKKAKWATMLGVFALGSYTGDILKSTGEVLSSIIPDEFKNYFSDLSSSVKTEVKEILNNKVDDGGKKVVGVPADGKNLTAGGAINSETLLPNQPTSAPTSSMSAIGSDLTSGAGDVRLPPTTQGYNFTAPDFVNPEASLDTVSGQIIEISPGDTLSEVMMDNISEQFPEFDDLTPKGQANFVYNILANLSPEQLQEIGVKSRDADLISPENKIDFSKLHDIAKDMKITYGGQEMNLLERAKLLK